VQHYGPEEWDDCKAAHKEIAMHRLSMFTSFVGVIAAASVSSLLFAATLV
jgi:hypothetical protein